MAGIAYPLWYTLKQNVSTALEAIATEEAAVSAARNFEVTIDKWRPYIESQQSTALANIMVQNVGQAEGRSGSRKSSMDEVIIMVDMYAIGGAGELLPADEDTAKRLDLLISQVREGLTRLAGQDFGMFDSGDPLIDRSINLTLQIYDQEISESTGQYAPARWSMTVSMPYVPTDNNTTVDLTELSVSVSEGDLLAWSALFDYS